MIETMRSSVGIATIDPSIDRRPQRPRQDRTPERQDVVNSCREAGNHGRLVRAAARPSGTAPDCCRRGGGADRSPPRDGPCVGPLPPPDRPPPPPLSPFPP